ncbi:MAG: hypothetical protein ACOQNV_03105 [Mycoplasmoidaceae bacterium]
MKSQSIFFVHSSHKTKTWWMFLSVLVLVFVPFLIVWLLSGEFNLLNNDWLIAKNTSVWHGVIQANQIQHLVERYSKYTTWDLQSFLSSHVGESWSIDSSFTFFNPLILAPLLCLLAWSFAYPIIFNATKVSGIDVLPFSFGIGSFMIILILTGLMDQWGQNLLPVYWIVRTLIALVGMATVFILSNYFVNQYIANSNYAADFYFGYKTIDKENALAKEELKENLGIFKKQKDEDESYVEVKEGD